MRYQEDNFIAHYDVMLIILAIFVFLIYIAWKWA
jgi:hypothetical protein